MILTALLSIFVVLNACSAEDINNGEDSEIMAKATESRYRVKGDRVSFPVEVFDMLMGRYNNGGFRRGGCGVTYIRWGRTSCPSGATILYTGRAGGSHYTQKGGGANYLCVPNNPQYLRAGGGGHVPLYGAEYQHPLMTRHDFNVPCSVCYASSRSAKVMIPAAIGCPNQWTKEYRGYLMTDNAGHPNNKVFECVDENSETIPGTQRNTDGALFYHVTSSCGAGMPCPPFIKSRPITCIVCTK